MHAAVFDLETSALEAIGAGVLLCAVVRPLGQKNRVFRADEMGCRYGQEKELVDAVTAELSQYDLLIGHNLIGFDVPWLRSRAVYFDSPVLPRLFAYDTFKAFKRLGYKTVPNHFGKPSAGLGHVVDFFGEDNDKTGIYPRHHWEVVWGDEAQRAAAMGDLVNHCAADVRLTERIYWKLMKADERAVIRRV
jgi:uncharacterized protein YprB with RNaseH-like and TPR domain